MLQMDFCKCMANLYLTQALSRIAILLMILAP